MDMRTKTCGDGGEKIEEDDKAESLN